MKHNREDYEQIQDPSGKIPEDEPVFLLRAQDKTAPDTVEMWAARVALEGGDLDIVDHANAHAQLMREWQEEHGCKVPDMPKEV